MINYRLDDLGWYQFEILCQSTLAVVYGGGVEAWGGSKDGGRDAFCRSDLHWKQEVLVGPIVFQAKFVERANAAGADIETPLTRAVTAEATRIKERSVTGGQSHPNSYVLMTNAPIGASLRKKLTVLLGKAMPQTTVKLVSGEDIANWLTDLPNIRQSFPQLLGLQDLQSLLSKSMNAGLKAKSKAALKEAHDLSLSYVETESYLEAASCLEEHHFALLSGPPEIGKTAAAHVLALEAAAQGFELVFCRTPDDSFFPTVDEPGSKFYIVDDAFGSNQYDSALADLWGRELHLVLRALDPTKKIVFTSRSNPLRAALGQMHLQPSARHFGQVGLVVFTPDRLTRMDRGRIVYVHARAAALKEDQKNSLVDSLHAMISSEDFTPLRAKNFVAALSSETLDGASVRLRARSLLDRTFFEPSIAMRLSLDNLDRERRYYLFATLDTSGSWSEEEIHEAFKRIYPEAGQLDPNSIGSSLADHYIKPDYWGTTDESAQTWVHPTWKDLLVSYIAARNDIRQSFLGRCSYHGINVALGTSTGWDQGGAMPLMVDADDWGILTRNLEQKAQGCDHNGPWEDLIIGFAFAAEHRWPKGMNPTGNETSFAHRLMELAESVFWENPNPYEAKPQTHVIRAFAKLASICPIPFQLEIHQIWKDRLDQIDLHLTHEDSSIDHAFLEWLTLAHLVIDEDWFFSDELDDMESYAPVARKVLKRQLRAMTDLIHSVHDRDRISLILDCVGACHYLFPSLNRLGEKIRDTLPRLEAEAELWQEEEKNEETARYEEALEAGTLHMVSGDSADPEDIFSDL